MEQTTIKIATVKRQFKDSNYGDGQYAITEITDAKTGRKGTCMGPYGEGWKEGDEVEVKWEKRDPWTDRNGNVHEQWALKNPNAKPFNGPKGGNNAASPESHGQLIAAALLAPAYAGNITAAQIPELVSRIKTMGTAITTEMTPALPTAPAAPAAPAPQPAPVAPVAAPAAPAVTATAPMPEVTPTPAPAQTTAAVDTTPAPQDHVADDKPF
jgi:hypothetical protein